MPLAPSALSVVDTTALTVLPRAAEVRAYRRGRAGFTGPRVRVRPCLGGIGYTTLLVVSGTAAIGLGTLHAEPRAVLLCALLAIGSAIGAALCARSTRAMTMRREYRLAACAARNGLRYERGAVSPSTPGLRFSDTGGRALRRLTGSVGGASVEAGNYEHPTGLISGYVIVDGRSEVVPAFDFSSPAEWHRLWREFQRLS
ncbi:hypothetical protein N1031_12515 [Herbiconiux moechotypicola]|uniref:Uncharacterized protein n=1 Tax=Herbiconiux moechotypicola TaxID=637393 RepID=A0ABP5QNU8_9MICO|nr:hypothetical protein [Herbiconiux moechotypicola]MCS5730588.1 hypothetical protein [Herbiconiux moechotypicola]